MDFDIHALQHWDRRVLDGVAADGFQIESASVLVAAAFAVHGWDVDEYKLTRMSDDRRVDLGHPWDRPPQHDLRELAL